MTPPTQQDKPIDLEALRLAAEAATPGPWQVCRHLESVEADSACPCGYRGVIYGPDHDIPMAICQPGHVPEPEGQEGTGPQNYSRVVQIADSRFIATWNPATALALLALIDAQQKQIAELSGWQPIDTAPQDGYMLVHEDGAIRAMLRFEGAWQNAAYPAIINQWGDAMVGEDAKRLLPAGYRLELRDGCCQEPKEWHPLPPAPVQP